MIAPTVMGRKLPRNDSELDDHVPGGGIVTCRDTSLGRDIAFATNGRIDEDGSVYRASLHPTPTGGTSIAQSAQEALAVAHLTLVVPHGWQRKNVKTHLRYARGLIVDGWYDALAPEDRMQQGSDHFTHSMFISHISQATFNWRVWDPLDKNLNGYGRWIPEASMWAFIESLNFQVSYVPLQSL